MKRGQRSISHAESCRVPVVAPRPAPVRMLRSQISDPKQGQRSNAACRVSVVAPRPTAPNYPCACSDVSMSHVRSQLGRSPTPVGGADQANDISKCCSSIYSPFHLVKIKIKTKKGVRAIEAYESAGQPGAVNAGDREVYAGQPPGAGAGFWASDAT